MTRPRSQLVDLQATPYYHCIARCVRRAFLCGHDRYFGKNFDHRKPWLVDRLKMLADVFAIDIAAYAVMSNHYHVVLHVDENRANAWSDAQVIAHWTRLYSGPDLVQRYKAGSALSDSELELLKTLAARWRKRLYSLSWFMRCLNEYLARRANAEDGCKGRFWDKSQALLDESALLSCMAYVDLNPIRAGIAENVESSDFTSIQDRIKELRQNAGQDTGNSKDKLQKKTRLMPFLEAQRDLQDFAGIPFTLRDYLELVDWTGRVVRQGKRGAIDTHEPALLDTLGLSGQEWQILALQVQKQSITLLKGLEKIAVFRSRTRAYKAA